MHDFINSSLYNYTILHKFYKAILILYPENFKQKLKSTNALFGRKKKLYLNFCFK